MAIHRVVGVSFGKIPSSCISMVSVQQAVPSRRILRNGVGKKVKYNINGCLKRGIVSRVEDQLEEEMKSTHAKKLRLETYG